MAAPKKKGEPPNQSKAAKKKSYASRTPQARAYKTPGNVTDSGAGNIPASVMRAAMTIAKFASKNKSTAKPKPKTSAAKRTTASQAQKDVASTRAANKNYRDSSVRAQQRKVDEQMAKDKKARAEAAKIRSKAQQQGVTRAGGGDKPRGARRYN
jgi:hypothetical protein